MTTSVRHLWIVFPILHTGLNPSNIWRERVISSNLVIIASQDYFSKSTRIIFPSSTPRWTHEEKQSLTLVCMYLIKKGCALKLSTGKSKNPWISFWWRSMVMRCWSPDFAIILANSLATKQPPPLKILPWNKKNETPFVNYQNKLLVWGIAGTVFLVRSHMIYWSFDDWISSINGRNFRF